MGKEKNVIWFIDELLRLFRDMKPKEINEIMEIFRKNDELRLGGYGWKRVKVRCTSVLKCGWEGRRLWRKSMFDKPCPKCHTVFRSGKTTIFCPPHMV